VSTGVWFFSLQSALATADDKSVKIMPNVIDFMFMLSFL